MNKEEWVRKLKHLAVNSKDLTGDVLIAIEETLDNALFVYNHPSFMANGSAGRAIMAEIEEAQERRRLKDIKRRLRYKQYVKLSEEGDRIICLTNAGQARCLETKIRQKSEELPEGWLCVAAFDIPEDMKQMRRNLRYKLRHLGFELHQRSVWISKQDICKEMHQYIQLIKAEKWVTIFRAKPQTVVSDLVRSD